MNKLLHIIYRLLKHGLTFNPSHLKKRKQPLDFKAAASTPLFILKKNSLQIHPENFNRKKSCVVV